jgi:hypothetical protein
MAARKGAAGRAASPPAPPAQMPAEERRAKLDRVVRNRSREGRAEVKSRDDFSAVLKGGTPVKHRLHLIGAVAITAVGAWTGRFFLGDAGLLVGVAAGAGYALFWAFLAVTGGFWYDHLAVDEQGVVTSEISGHAPHRRGDFLKVGIPAALIAYCLFLVVGLSHDLVYPPAPHCNVSPPPPNACLLLPNLADALGGLASAQATAGPSFSPVASPGVSAAPAGTTQGAPLSVDDAIALERIVRGFQLFFATVVLLSSAWFLRRMLTGRWVVAVAPVRREGE